MRLSAIILMLAVCILEIMDPLIVRLGARVTF